MNDCDLFNKKLITYAPIIKTTTEIRLKTPTIRKKITDILQMLVDSGYKILRDFEL